MVRPNSIDVNRSYEQHQQLLRQQAEQQRQMQNQNYVNGHVVSFLAEGTFLISNNGVIFRPKLRISIDNQNLKLSSQTRTIIRTMSLFIRQEC